MNKADTEKLRKYGNAPFDAAVIHGGPGAPGEMAPVAREISSVKGVLEPLQTAASIQGQVKELKTVLETNGNLPVTLIGFSWGAWLSFIFTAQHPTFTKINHKNQFRIMKKLSHAEISENRGTLETLDKIKKIRRV